jgi:hypothetical protein
MRPAPEPPVTFPAPVAATVSVDAATNVAATDREVETVTVQVVAVPEHAPDQPENRLPADAVAVSVTCAFGVCGHVQVPAEQLAGEPPDVPETLPEPTTVTETWLGLNVAVTLLAEVIATAQTLFWPEHAPDQPANTDPADGVAVRYTVELENSGALHVVAPVPQSMRPKPEPPVTLPAPVAVTLRVEVGRNVAVIDRAVEMVTVQLVPVPEHAPDQPANW